MQVKEVDALISLVTSSKRVLNEDFFVGSPCYGVARYEIPDWQITLLTKYKWVESKLDNRGRSQEYAFGRKFVGEYSYRETWISHPECEIEFKRLTTYTIGFHSHGYPRVWIDSQTATDKDYSLVQVGDTIAVESLLAYLKLMASLDNNTTNTLIK